MQSLSATKKPVLSRLSWAVLSYLTVSVIFNFYIGFDLCNFAAEKKLFDFLRLEPPPVCYDEAYELPDGIRFLFDTAAAASSTMIVRGCYERIWSIIDKKVRQRELGTGRGAGIIFTGAQGNSKVLLNQPFCLFS